MRMTSGTLRYAAAIIVCMLAGFCAHASETAGQILDRCADRIGKAHSITFRFNITAGNERSDCELIISHDRYRLSSRELEIWYDGTTQWSYSPQDSEVSITEPTEEELAEINPFAILSNYKTNYSYRLLSGNGNEIELVSKNKMSPIRKAVVFIDPKTNFPTKLIVTMTNGRAFTVNVVSVTEGKALPATVFKYNKDKYPAKTINDLR